MLAECDYVVLSVELNNETFHMIGKDEFSAMKDSAFLVNMGRGELVDELEMIEALQSGTIAGAGLDTFEKEPLDQDNPLWDMQNVIITPHITPMLPDREERSLEYVYQNIEAYRTGSDFVNQLSQKNVYSRGFQSSGLTY
jgi:phosphoglycerate dehydrogenase-like enzyme